MSNWNDVVRYLTRNYKCDTSNNDLIRLVFNFGERSQLLIVSRGQGAQGDWVHIQSPIGQPSSKGLIGILEDCGSKLCGAVVMIGGTAFLRHAIPLATFNNSDFDWALKAIVTTADDLEEKHVGGDKY